MKHDTTMDIWIRKYNKCFIRNRTERMGAEYDLHIVDWSQSLLEKGPEIIEAD